MLCGAQGALLACKDVARVADVIKLSLVDAIHYLVHVEDLRIKLHVL